MSDPYRNDEVGKLQAENEKLREQYDGLMYKYSVLKKWPMLLALILLLGAIGAFWYYAGKSSAPRVSTGSVFALSSDDRRAMGAEVAREVNARISAVVQTPTPARACPASPVCANGTDEHVLGMNKVVSGTIGGQETGPLSMDWKFSARAGDEVIFRMKKITGELDPVLALVDRAGNILSLNYNVGVSLNATVRYRFASDGVYILRCMQLAGHAGLNEGSYTLSATRVARQ